MQFGSYPARGAAGAILAHGVRTGDVSLRKGRLLGAEDIAALIEAGVETVTIAWPQPGDVREDEAAARIAKAAAGTNVRVGAAFTGRANLYALEAGLVLVDGARVDALNRLDEAITCATLAPFARVSPPPDAGDDQDHSFRRPRNFGRGHRETAGRRAARHGGTLRAACRRAHFDRPARHPARPFGQESRRAGNPACIAGVADRIRAARRA